MQQRDSPPCTRNSCVDPFPSSTGMRNTRQAGDIKVSAGGRAALCGCGRFHPSEPTISLGKQALRENRSMAADVVDVLSTGVTSRDYAGRLPQSTYRLQFNAGSTFLHPGGL